MFFDEGELREPYQNGGGSDLLYVSELEIDPDWQGRMIEEATVRRLAEVWGGSCNVAIFAVRDLLEAQRWERVGFNLTALALTAARAGYVAMDMTMKQPRIVETELGKDAYSVEPLSSADDA